MEIVVLIIIIFDYRDFHFEYMVDKVEVTVTDLEKKHKGKSGYKNMYSVAKHVYMDNGLVDIIA